MILLWPFHTDVSGALRMLTPSWQAPSTHPWYSRHHHKPSHNTLFTFLIPHVIASCVVWHLLGTPKRGWSPVFLVYTVLHILFLALITVPLDTLCLLRYPSQVFYLIFICFLIKEIFPPLFQSRLSCFLILFSFLRKTKNPFHFL